MIVVCIMILIFEYELRPYMHSAFPYRILCIAIPGILAGVSRASGRRWAASIVIGIYSLFLIGCVWILPLFPAVPKLGPVYQNVKQFVPPEFPLLLIVPALALDWLWARTPNWKPWQQAAISGPVFLVLIVAVQWPFATFLMSPASRNWVFGTIYFDYNLRPSDFYVNHRFFPVEKTVREFWTQMALAAGLAMVTTRLGMGWGNWMRRIRR
jgi:hypothetical protein